MHIHSSSVTNAHSILQFTCAKKLWIPITNLKLALSLHVQEKVRQAHLFNSTPLALQNSERYEAKGNQKENNVAIFEKKEGLPLRGPSLFQIEIEKRCLCLVPKFCTELFLGIKKIFYAISSREYV